MRKSSRFHQITFLLATILVKEVLDIIKIWMHEEQLDFQNSLRLRKFEFELRISELIQSIKNRTRLDAKLVQERFGIIKRVAAKERF